MSLAQALAVSALLATATAQQVSCELQVVSTVRGGYSLSRVSGTVENSDDWTQQASFTQRLSDSAFVTGFYMSVDGQQYELTLVERSDAQRGYSQAVEKEATAARVEISEEDPSLVVVSVSVEADHEAAFTLTYEELLHRERDAYQMAVDIGQALPLCSTTMEVRINETDDISSLEVIPTEDTNDIGDRKNSSVAALVERPSPSLANVRWSPETGSDVTLVLRYDIRRGDDRPLLLTADGYWAHPPPTSPPPLPPRHLLLVLDDGPAVWGRRRDALQEAAGALLDQLEQQDVFSLLIYGHGAQVWLPGSHLSDSDSHVTDQPAAFNDSAIVPATAENILQAKQVIKRMNGAQVSDLLSGLINALRVAEVGARSDSPRQMSPLIVLFPGDTGISPKDQIFRHVTDFNTGVGAALFALPLAELEFFKTLTLCNGGFARRLYEDADAVLQLQELYRQLASPALTDLSFAYDGRKVSCNYTLPAKQPVETSSNSRQRFWAFLEVQRLLQEGAQESTHPLNYRATQLAFKYSLVTPLTSLVTPLPQDTEETDGNADEDCFSILINKVKYVCRLIAMACTLLFGW